MNADAAERITAAAQAVGVPILVGAVLRGPKAGQVRNAGLVWTAQVQTTATYIKRHPVPFAEYVPLRPCVGRITTLVDRVRSDFVAGTGFEVAYDGLVRDTVIDGADLLVVQTNNTTFDSAQTEQQLAMVRLRALEHARPAVMASTVGISAIISSDGTPQEASGFNTAAVIVRAVPLAATTTAATRLGAIPELILALGALSALLISLTVSRGARFRCVRRPRVRTSA